LSCQNNSNKAGRAGLQAGLSELANKAAYVVGTRVDQIADARGRLNAPVAAAMIDKAKGPRRVAGALAGGAWQVAGFVPEIRAAKRVVKTVERFSGLAGNLIGEASRKEEGQTRQVIQEQRTLLFFKSQTPVTLWKSGLTGAINRRDAPPGTGRPVVSSEGMMFRVGGKTWHQGTTVADLPAGRRTVTHLQSLAIPSPHYYFDRPISDEHAVGLAAGRIKPEEVPGFVGQVSQQEELCTVWGQTKHALLRTRLYWPVEDKE